MIIISFENGIVAFISYRAVYRVESVHTPGLGTEYALDGMEFALPRRRWERVAM